MPQVAVAALLAAAPANQELASRYGTTVVDPQDLAGGTEAVGGATHALLLGERRNEVLVRRQAAALSDTGVAVAWRALPNGPAALLLLATQAAQAKLEPAYTVALFDSLVAGTWDAVWTPSVARLEDPAPSVGQHLRSWGPGGAGFLVTLAGDRPGVHPVAGASDTAGPSTGATARDAVYCGGLAGVPEKARAHVLRDSGARRFVDVPALHVDLTARVGSRRAVEVVALPDMGGVRLPTANGSCPTCGVVLVTPFCPFCHLRRPQADNRRGDHL